MSDKITTKLVTERNNLVKLKGKEKDIKDKIAITEKKIKDYETLLEHQKYAELSALLNERGVSKEELITALQYGTFSELFLELERKIKNSE